MSANPPRGAAPGRTSADSARMRIEPLLTGLVAALAAIRIDEARDARRGGSFAERQALIRIRIGTGDRFLQRAPQSLVGAALHVPSFVSPSMSAHR